MTIYTYPRCGYSNKIRAHMKKHFLRKNYALQPHRMKKLNIVMKVY